MAASQTINMDTYLNGVPDKGSSSKSYMDTSSDFANFLDDANKSYINKDTNFNLNKEIKNINEKISQTQIKESKTEKEDMKSLENASDNKNVKIDEPQNTTADKKEIENTVSKDISSSKNPHKNENLLQKTLINEITDSATTKESANLPINQNTSTDISETQKEEPIVSMQILENKENLTTEPIKLQTESKMEVQNSYISNKKIEKDESDTLNDLKIVKQASKTQNKTDSATLYSQVENLDSEINVNDLLLENINKNNSIITKNIVDKLENSQANSLLQSQINKETCNINLTKETEFPIQQIQMDINPKEHIQFQDSKKEKAEIEGNVLKTFIHSKNIEQNTQTQTANQINIPSQLTDKDSQIMIQNNVINNEIKTELSKEDIKTMLNKVSINQELLDKTNAHIINIEKTEFNSNSNRNNLLNQNAKEEIIKITLESNNKIINSSDSLNSDTTMIPNTTINNHFEKTIENIQTKSTKTLTQNDIMAQINSKLETIQNGSETKVNIILKPEHLGKINLELINSKDGFIARMTTDNLQVKEILDKNLDSLKNNLSNHGINVNNVSVKVDATQEQSHDMFSSDSHQFNQNNQNFSRNSNQSTERDLNFDEKINYFEDGTTSQSELSENSDSVDFPTGKIDYKV